MATLDVARVKKDFPLLQQQVNGHRIVYLDSGASSEKPQAVLDAMDEAYTTYYANVHRSVYKIAAESRYTSRLPSTCVFRIGKSALMRAMSKSLMMMLRVP